MDKKKIWESYRFPLILLAGIIIGALIGVIFGEKATVLQPVGQIFINLMFTIVVPMVFVSITSAVGSMLNMKRLGKILGSMVVTFIATGVCAAILVLVVVNIWPPAANTSISMGEATMQEATDISQMIVSTLTVDDFSGLMSRDNMLPIIIFAIIAGVAVAACGGQESQVGRLLANLNDVIMKIVDMIMKLAPIGLGAYFANLVGEFGPQLIGDYGRTLLIYYPMCAVYAVIFFPIYTYIAGGKTGVKKMLQNIFNPAVTAFATQSSVAALPANMEACHEIGVFQMPFTGAGTYAMAIVVAVLSAFVLSGAPGGGLVGEMLIVSLFGFPGEAFPLIATIGFLVDPAATCLNSSGDTIASMIVARVVEGKDWLKKAAERKTAAQEI